MTADGSIPAPHSNPRHHRDRYGQARGFRELADSPTDPLMLLGFSSATSSNGFPSNKPIEVHKGRALAPGTPFQFRCGDTAKDARTGSS